MKPESEIYWRLARRLGFSEEAVAQGRIPGAVRREIEAHLAADLAPFPELTLERLAEGPVLAPGAEEVAFADRRFPTPSGQDRTAVGRRPRSVGSRRAAALARAGRGARGESRYPLHLMTPNTKNAHPLAVPQSALDPRSSTRSRLSMHPDDARGPGLDAGDRARIFNDRGRALAARCASITASAPACVSCRTVLDPEGGAVNFLSAARETDMGYGAAFHENLVEVEG